MSGQSAIRGFTYQTIISTIKSLSDANWSFLKVEPNTANDKVDILLENHQGQFVCQQVKSSKTNFSKPDINNWLAEIQADVPNALRYELFLIGNVATGTDDFINEKNKEDHINIEIIPFRLDYLEGIVQNELFKLLSSLDYHLSHTTIELIAGGLIYQFFQFSVLGTRVSKADFLEHLLKWARSNYSKDLGVKKTLSAFNIRFYDRDAKSMTSEVFARKVTLKLDHFSEQNSKVFGHFNNAFSIKLPPREVKKETSTPNPFAILMPSEIRKADFNWDRREFVKDNLLKYFDIQVSEDFFNVGNLMISNSLMINPFANNNTYFGSDNEKKKLEELNFLYWELVTLVELRVFLTFINEHHFVGLSIENLGTSFDEDVRVNLQFPKEIHLSTYQNFHIPDDLDALAILLDKNFLSNLIRIRPDSILSEYPGIGLPDYESARILDEAYKLSSGAKQLEVKKQRFQSQLDHVFDFQMFNDLPAVTQLRFDFHQVNPNIPTAFPCYLLFKADKDFCIDYKITTKNSSVIHQNTLKVKIEATGESL